MMHLHPRSLDRPLGPSFRSEMEKDGEMEKWRNVPYALINHSHGNFQMWLHDRISCNFFSCVLNCHSPDAGGCLVNTPWYFRHVLSQEYRFGLLPFALRLVCHVLLGRKSRRFEILQRTLMIFYFQPSVSLMTFLHHGIEEVERHLL